MTSTSRSPWSSWIPCIALLLAGALVIGCTGPDAFFRDAGGGPPQGAGGSGFGVGGNLAGGSGGSGQGGAGVGGKSGIGGATGAGGRIGVGGSGLGGALGAGGSGVGGRLGTGGSGTGGALGVGGSGVGGGSVVDAGMGTGGVTVTGCPPGIYCDDFEADTVGAMPAGWTRLGGSAGDWEVATDPASGKAFAQDHAQSSTYRIASANVAPWSGATTLSAQVRLLLAGSSTPTTALVCLRYVSGSDAYCLALIAGTGAQIQARNGGTMNGSGALSATTIAIGTAYNVQLSVSASGVVSASVGGAAVPSFTPATITASGVVAVATQNAEASFDKIVVSQP